MVTRSYSPVIVSAVSRERREQEQQMGHYNLRVTSLIQALLAIVNVLSPHSLHHDLIAAGNR